MAALRFLIERLLAFLTSLASVAFWAQGVAFGVVALLILPRLGGAHAEPWIGVATRTSLLLGAAFTVGGILLFVLRLGSRAAPGPAAPSSRDTVAALLLLLLAALAFVSAAPLRDLWVEIRGYLSAMGDWHELTRNAQGSGLVLAPLLVILYPPILCGLSALVLITLPALLAVARAARSARFAQFFAMAVIMATVLVGAAWAVTDAFVRLMAMAEPILRRDPDPTAAQVAQILGHGTAVLARAVRIQAMLLAGLWILWPLLRRPAPDPALQYPELDPAYDTSPLPAAAPEPPPAPAHSPAHEIEWHTAESDPTADHDLTVVPRAGTPSGFALTAPLLIGLLMLAIGIADGMRPRASRTASSPAPGEVLQAVPGSVEITFDRELANGSQLSVNQTQALHPETGEMAAGAGLVTTTARVDPGDRRRLRAELTPAGGDGLYWVQWRAVSRGMGVPRNGSFAFVVGAVPADLAGGTPAQTAGRDENQRRRRSILLGGVVFVLLGAMQWARRNV
jgi:methionine-rich copper-binding protein CopC